MSFDPVAALQSYHAAIDAHDLEKVAAMLAENARYSSDGLGAVVGRDAIIAAMRAYFTGHPDHQSWDDETIKTGAQSARSLWKLKATNKTTGHIVHRHGVENVSFDASGKILTVDVRDET
jgi:hypothetical protein